MGRMPSGVFDCEVSGVGGGMGNDCWLVSMCLDPQGPMCATRAAERLAGTGRLILPQDAVFWSIYAVVSYANEFRLYAVINFSRVGGGR